MDWSPTHVLSFEDRLSSLVNNDYLIAAQRSWWEKIVTVRQTDGRTEELEFMLTTAGIHPLDDGQMIYDELVSSSFRITNRDKGAALKVTKNQFRDDRLEKAAQWANTIGTAIAIQPQYDAEDMLGAGETRLGYDGVPFFATNHPVNPFDASLLTYSNLLTANPLVDVDGKPIIANYAKALAKLRSYKMPNGRSRNLQAAYLIVGPDLEYAAQLLTQARLIDATDNAFGASFGALENGVRRPVVEVIVINTMAAGEWILVATDIGMSVLPLIYSLRDPYEMNSYDGVTQVMLNISNTLEWQVRGRNDMIYGHPYSAVKSKP